MMFSLANNLELRIATISSLISCIYLPSLITVISYNGLLYTMGKRSSWYMLVIIFVAELLNVLYLRNCSLNTSQKKNKIIKNKANEIIKISVFLLCNVLVYFIVIILFGAPVLERHEETLNLSVLLTLLTTFPLVSYVGIETCLHLLLRVKDYNRGSIIEMFVNNAIMAVFGGWVGAIVIPLDWNTPWQEWPIPCYLGVIGGYILSNVLTVMKAILVSAATKYPTLNQIVDIINKPAFK